MKKLLILLVPLLLACGDDPFRLTAESMVGTWQLSKVTFQDNIQQVEITSCTNIPPKVNLYLMELHILDLEKIDVYLPCYNLGPYPGYWVLRYNTFGMSLPAAGVQFDGEILSATETTLTIRFNYDIHKPIYEYLKQ